MHAAHQLVHVRVRTLRRRARHRLPQEPRTPGRAIVLKDAPISRAAPARARSANARIARSAATPVRRTQEERSATTRAQLVDAAGASIAELGLQQSTLAVIAERAGVTSGAVQHHFRSRNELLLAVVDAFGKSLGSRSADGQPADAAVAAQVKAMLARYWQLFGSRQYLAVMKIWLGTEVDAPLYRLIARRMRFFETRFDREWVEMLAASGKSADHIRQVRHVALGAMRGLALSLSFADRNRAGREVALLEAMVMGAL